MLIGILLSVLLSGQLVEPKPKGNSYYSPSDTTMLNAESFPTNYTFENDSEMQFSLGIILISPDQNWIVYTRMYDSKAEAVKNRIYFKQKGSAQNPSIYTFGSDKNESILNCQQCVKFNKKGDLLYFSTNKNTVYMCNFPSFEKTTVCDAKINPNASQSDHYDYIRIISIDVNELNQLALMKILDEDCRISVFQLKNGELVLKDIYPQYAYSGSLQWHPIDWQILVYTSFWSVNMEYVVRIGIINTTTKSKSSLDTNTHVYATNVQLDISGDGETAFIATLKGVYAFEYFQGNFSSKGNIYEKQYTQIKASRDGKLLIGYRNSAKSIQLLQIKKTTLKPQQQSLNSSLPSDTNYITQIKNKGNNISNSSIYLRLISNIPSVKFFYYSTPDTNQIIVALSDPPITTISYYRLCPHKTYLLNMECPSCSENCSDCHFAQSTCVTCPNNSYVLQNTICYPCFKYVANCSTCSNQSTCLSCTDFYYLSSNQCKLCDINGICKKCISETNCTKCDSEQGYEEDPVNSTCVCKQNYSFFDKKCINCNVIGCVFCEQDRKCNKCNQSQGYTENSQHGNCKCQTNYSQVYDKCVQCKISACLKCQQANKCIECSQKNYELSPDGKCIEKGEEIPLNLYILIGSGVGGVIIIGIIVGVYCKCKQKRKNQSSLIESRQSDGLSEDGDKSIEGRSLIRESVYRRTIEQRVSRSVIEERIEQPLLRDEKQKVKYSDEEKIRLRRLQNQSLVSN